MEVEGKAWPGCLPAVQLRGAAPSSQAVAAQVGRCLRCKVVFSYVHSVWFPDPSARLFLGLSPVFPALPFPCRALLDALCLVLVVLCR